MKRMASLLLALTILLHSNTIISEPSFNQSNAEHVPLLGYEGALPALPDIPATVNFFTQKVSTFLENIERSLEGFARLSNGVCYDVIVPRSASYLQVVNTDYVDTTIVNDVVLTKVHPSSLNNSMDSRISSQYFFPLPNAFDEEAQRTTYEELVKKTLHFAQPIFFSRKQNFGDDYFKKWQESILSSMDESHHVQIYYDYGNGHGKGQVGSLRFLKANSDPSSERQMLPLEECLNIKLDAEGEKIEVGLYAIEKTLHANSNINKKIRNRILLESWFHIVRYVSMQENDETTLYAYSDATNAFIYTHYLGFKPVRKFTNLTTGQHFDIHQRFKDRVITHGAIDLPPLRRLRPLQRRQSLLIALEFKANPKSLADMIPRGTGREYDINHPFVQERLKHLGLQEYFKQ